ncbi:tyrosine-type recombinase/integrase [Planctomicrobium sp. SH661]|uniref:tyrosine-type recombinase/integrase n=1 Tax=Planctomicrobium sp. SH661 TaxID=3448124 RepID=UPI003F5C05B8
MKKPFYWKARKAWYVKDDSGSQIKLGSDREAAFKKYHQRMAGQIEAADDVKATEIIDQYLDWSEAHQAASTFKNYSYWLKSFSSHVKGLSLRDLKPYHVARWLDKHGWTGSTGNGAVRAAVRPFNWAKKLGVIRVNPLERVERPAATARECYITPEQFEKIMGAISDHQFKDFVSILRETGCRPQEGRNIEARHFDRLGQTIVFPREESKGKRHARVIVLTPTALAIVQRLVLKNPTGPIFRNLAGRKWTKDALNNRFSRLSEKLGFPVSSYFFRHAYCTDALINGVDPITVASLMGHTSLKMIQEVYNKIRMRQDHMKKAAIQAAERKQA